MFKVGDRVLVVDFPCFLRDYDFGVYTNSPVGRVGKVTGVLSHESEGQVIYVNVGDPPLFYSPDSLRHATDDEILAFKLGDYDV